MVNTQNYPHNTVGWAEMGSSTVRIVEHSYLNPRGIIVIEELSANILSRVKMNADYDQVFALHLTTNNASSL